MQLREAADALGVHYQTAYGWVRHGVLPARKTAGGYEVSEGDVRALAERRPPARRRGQRSGFATGRPRPSGYTRRS